MRSLFNVFILVFVTCSSIAQPVPIDWMHMSPSQGYHGVTASKAYTELLKDKLGTEVVVAVIDSGVDINHEDLFQNIWVNLDEIPDNGIDDDNNGYIDDVNGWNFIGGKDGSNVDGETLEVTRLYASLRSKYENVDPLALSDDEKYEYAHFLSYKKEIDENRKKAQENMDRLLPIVTTVTGALDALAPNVKSDFISLKSLEEIETTEQMVLIGKSIMTQIISDEGVDSLHFKETADAINFQLSEEIKPFDIKLNYQYNPDYDSRIEVVKDNYEDSKEMNYGNNDVEGPDPFHGTHVSGIIAAIRDNEIGMNGIAQNVKIMSIRTVPDGDERDKDVANAIRYAVDNGASIINMSFGKGYAWDKDVVDDAVKYADKKDVLMIHASGNDGMNIDLEDNFPNDNYNKTGFFLCKKKQPKTWIEVGALSYMQDGNNVASFSNYGKEEVDLFAPGMAIYSTLPNDQYSYLQGTSFAAPVVAGVAAVLRSHFPTLKAEQVKEILLDTVDPIDIEVKRPGDGEMVPFSELSKTGGVVNLYNAVVKAMNTKGKKKLKKPKDIRV